MNQCELNDFTLAVPKLTTLEHITWDVTPFPWVKWYNTIRVWHHELPTLRTLQLIISQNGGEAGDDSETVALTNLQSLAIKFTGVFSVRPDKGPNFQKPHQGSDLVGEPLNYLRLCLQNISQTCAVGPAFRRFIENHNQLQDLVIHPIDDGGWLGNVDPPLVTATRDMERLIPSIRQFGGATPNVDVLLASSLAGQLEGLEIFIHPNDPARTGVQDIPSLKVLSLRTFKFKYRSEEAWAVILDVLAVLSPRMPALQELSINLDGSDYWWEKLNPDNLPKLLHVLSQHPDLRRLTIIQASLPNQKIYDRITGDFPLLKVTFSTSFREASLDTIAQTRSW
ncbi:hypothetical protein OPQ81_000832 [Rhizoctonia solani]|nr:hypothetical protein OPQ81_000832 [Rhizoctonia solani]